MTELIYEQPLNEKTRSYLRLEHLAEQLRDNLLHDQKHRCFYPLFSLCELTERCDYRGEILKDIDRQILSLTNTKQPHIDTQTTTQQINRLKEYRESLQSSERLGTNLKQNRFLSALRQRFSMPGASCNFDLPQLHFWLAKPLEQRQREFQQWISAFEAILNPIQLLLQITRETSSFRQETAHAGFFQGGSSEPLSLIRVKINANQGCYPTISGHRNRYAIHFVMFEQQRHSDNAISFELATCV